MYGLESYRQLSGYGDNKLVLKPVTSAPHLLKISILYVDEADRI